MTDTVRHVQFRQPRRVSAPTVFQRMQGIVADLEAMGGSPSPSDLRSVADRLNELASTIERGDA
ncbi:hypothetical protein [Azospirillum sp.]|uniref:hypothetical protein n=1 Tax=Azospirillum sp. TaxID=34012 RepID=UPI003D743376